MQEAFKPDSGEQSYPRHVRDPVVPDCVHPAFPVRLGDSSVGHVPSRGLEGVLPGVPGSFQVSSVEFPACETPSGCMLFGMSQTSRDHDELF